MNEIRRLSEKVQITTLYIIEGKFVIWVPKKRVISFNWIRSDMEFPHIRPVLIGPQKTNKQNHYFEDESKTLSH